MGGYFLAPLLRLGCADIKRIQGVVEVTKFGHNRHEEKIQIPPLPVFTIAESQIKMLEGRFVGLSAVAAVENILRDFGLSMSGRRALVIGFGLIGKSVAAALGGRNLPVKVFDIRGFPKTEAFTLGHLVGGKKELLSRSDLILSSTANTSLSYDDPLQCKDGAVIGSVGSQQNEIDVESLNERCVCKKQIHDHVTEYKLQNGKTLFLLKNGEAINFLVQSCPDEVIDLIFAETIHCWKLLVDEERRYAPGRIHRTPLHITDMIAESWLALAGVDSY